MNRYIEQLVDDIRQAAQNAPGVPASDDELLPGFYDEDPFDEIESELNATEEKLSEIVGIPLAMLPSPEKLNSMHLKLVTNALIHLLDAWHFIPEFPLKAPYDLKYKALRTIWENNYPYSKNGYFHIEFCDFNPKNCLFTGYCDLCIETGNKINERIDLEGFGTRREDISSAGILKDDDIPQASEDEFIIGIDNFCDTWCERCSFTDKCKHFAIMKDFDKILDEPENALDDRVEINEFQDITEDNNELGVAFDETGWDDDYESGDDFFSPGKKAHRHPLMLQTDQFTKVSRSWLDEKHKGFENNLTHWIAKGRSDEMINAFEILFRYNIVIYLKIRRAITGYYDQMENEFMVYDMNGTAKLVLVSIDRSLEAWRILRRNLKQDRDFISQRQQELEAIRLETETLFPEARNFVRPGLDE